MKEKKLETFVEIKVGTEQKRHVNVEVGRTERHKKKLNQSM